jgi:hypothetical protein
MVIKILVHLRHCLGSFVRGSSLGERRGERFLSRCPGRRGRLLRGLRRCRRHALIEENGAILERRIQLGGGVRGDHGRLQRHLLALVEVCLLEMDLPTDLRI